MKILVVAATHAETSILAEHFQLGNDEFTENQQFDLLITGVGMTATAFALGQRLSKHYELVLNLGIAGTFDRNLQLGTLLNIVSDRFYELGAEDHDQFISIDELGFGKSTFEALQPGSHPDVDTLRKVPGITVNRVHGNAESISALLKKIQPVVESMEGAAIFYCCQQAGIPCLQIRAISNYVEPRNRKNWQIGIAIKNLNQWAIGFLTNR